MILPDINLLVYAYNSASEQHKVCSAWLEKILNGNEPVCFSWPTIIGFIRILTTVKMVANPYSPKQAMDIAGEWLSTPVSMMLVPGDEHFAIFRQLVIDSGIVGARLADAHIAALAIEHNATVATSDKDFRAFDGVKWINPLSGHSS